MSSNPESRSDLPERTFDFARRIVGLCMKLEETRGVGVILARQLLRSGTSIGANVEEGQASQSRADFAAKYSIACKEARETRYWPRLLAASGILPESKMEPILDEANQLVSILTAIIKKTRASNPEGSTKSRK